MFRMKVEGSQLRVLERDCLHSGAVGVYRCGFALGAGWEGLDVTVVFRAGDLCVRCLPDEEGACAVPHELLEQAGAELFVGLRGSDPARQLLLPTEMVLLGRVLEGAPADGSEAAPPPTDVYEEILAVANAARETAAALRAAAQAGEFTPVKGVDYGTEEEKMELVAATLAALPKWEGGAF